MKGLFVACPDAILVTMLLACCVGKLTLFEWWCFLLGGSVNNDILAGKFTHLRSSQDGLLAHS